jgi:hypothetical protein
MKLSLDLARACKEEQIFKFLLFLAMSQAASLFIFSAMQKQSWVFLGAKTPHRQVAWLQKVT